MIGDFVLPDESVKDFPITRCTVAEAKRLDAAFMQKLSQAQAILYRTACPFTAEVLEQATRLRYIVKAGSGLGAVDTIYCQKRGIKVASVPGANARSVVELALWQALGLARSGSLFGNDESFHGIELAGKSAVIYGFGHIGQELGRLLEAFGMSTTGCGREAKITPLLQEADFLFITASLNFSSYGAIGADQLKSAKPALKIVAVSPAEILDQTAILSGVITGRIAALALDCIWLESDTKQRLLIKDLQNQGRLIVTNRLGASTVEARKRTSLAAWQCLQELLANEA